MNIFELIAGSAAIYRRNALRYAVAGLALLLATSVSIGWLSATLIIDGAIALSAGGEYGHWAKSVPHLLAVAGVTLAGLAAVSFLAFSLWGGFLNMCARIGEGGADAGILDFLGYGASRSRTFFAIGAAQLAAGTAFAIPGFVISIFILPVGIFFIWAGYAASAALFSLAYPAAVLDGVGAAAAIARGLKSLLSHPLAAIVMLAMCIAISAIGLAMFPLYPIYHFLIAAPLIAVILLAYYQRSK